MKKIELNKIYNMDCIEYMKTLPDNCIDSIVTDPPYEIGFMGKGWDNSGIANNVEMRSECLRILKPGGYLLSFSATRTYHRMAVAIEDAGFEIRDMIEWVYGSGFPKSHNIGKAVDKLQGDEREVVGKDRSGSERNCMAGDFTGGEYDLTKGTSPWEGWGTALKPAHEPICMARKPLSEKTIAKNCLKWGTGGINIDESRVGNKEGGNTVSGRFPANLIHDNSEEVRECFPETKSGKAKHNSEITRKGIATDGSSFNTETCGFDVNKCQGMANFGDSGNASRYFKSIIYQAKASKKERNKGCEGLEKQAKVFNGQSDKPSEDMKDVEKRFTTLPKANNHPTVKPIKLMEYLIKMITRPGGIVLDPFAGSGTTLISAKQNGFQYVGCELTEEYIPIIEARLADATNLFSQENKND